ncbi:putative colanic acid biosynthesis glycosyltransferase [Devosia sp. UYZn731]|uniref:glycosyltransferase n=1 Tax=Devosia sp. UYZn731 TaxID=3156345 RepID=UPI003396DC03
MRFSIVTIVWNNLSGLRKTAQSLREQRRELFEWIVVDGGSTDGTMQALGEFSGLMDHFQSGPDRGLYDAMNKGIARASGQYVLFLNGDDILLPDVLARTEQKLADEGCGYSLIFGEVALLFSNGRVRHRKVLPPDVHLWHRMPTSHQATFISLTDHRLIPHDLSYSVSSDYYTIAKIYQNRRDNVLLLDYEVAQTPIGGASFTARHPLRMLRDHHRIQTEVLNVPAVIKWASLARKAVAIGAIRIIQTLPGRA